MFESFDAYLRRYGKVGYVKVTENQSVYIGGVRYGKSYVYFNAYVDSKGAISDLIFDLRNVYEVYKGTNVKTGKLVFMDEIDIHKSLRAYSNDRGYFGVNDYESGDKNDKPYFALGISLVGYRNGKFNKYTPWAGAIYEVLEALDKAYGFEGKDKKNRIKREDVDKEANRTGAFFYFITGLAYLAGIAGVVLILLGIFKKISPVLGWIVGVIGIIIFLLIGLNFTMFAIRHKKEYYNNSGDLEKNFSEAKESMFG
ncbi:MAG: hypothetical protein ACI4MS_01055 [Candidatus Coproplasma sp.]